MPFQGSFAGGGAFLEPLEIGVVRLFLAVREMVLTILQDAAATA